MGKVAKAIRTAFGIGSRNKPSKDAFHTEDTGPERAARAAPHSMAHT